MFLIDNDSILHLTMRCIFHILDPGIFPFRYKQIEITQAIVSYHSGIKPEINNRKALGNSPILIG